MKVKKLTKGFFYNLLSKDVKEFNSTFLSLFCLLFLIVCGFISYRVNGAYALFSSIVKGENTIQVEFGKEVFINDVNYVSNVNADLGASEFLSFNNTSFSNVVSLSKDDGNSSITYNISVYNSGDVDAKFIETNCGILFDSNKNIICSLDGLSSGDIIKSKEYLNFNVTFHYVDNLIPVVGDENYIENYNLLETMINFKFYELYMVSFDANDGIVELSNKTVVYNQKYGELPIPKRNDYIFDGWYTAKSGGDLINEDSIVNLENDQTLYAHWSLVKYTITYNVNDGLVVPTNPSYYDKESSFSLNNPIVNRLGYRIEWTESLYTTNWKNGFINLSTGVFEEYNSNYPNAVISEKIYLKSGVTYTLTGISAGENRWRFFDTSGNYVKNSSSLSFTPSIDGYVIILLHNGADESTRNGIRIVSSQGEVVNINQGSTGNRIYTVDLIPTKVVIADIFDRDEVTINGNTPKINSDGSVSFDSSKKFNNILVKLPEGDYSKGVTIGLDVYLEISDEYTGDHDKIQSLLMARTTTRNSVFLFQWQSRIQWDLGDASNYRTTLDSDLTKTGRYFFLMSYSSVSGNVNKTVIIDKSTNKVIYNKTDDYSLSSLNDGISSTNYELQIGGDYYKTNNYQYDAKPQTKFYSYFFDNVGMTNSELEALIFEFGYGNVDIS